MNAAPIPTAGSVATFPTRVAVVTLGCKLNLAESDAIARELRAAGCAVFDRPADADAFVINSCAVTHVADRKSRHLVRLARRLSPGAIVALTGCYPETVTDAQARALGADIVLPSRNKARVVEALLDRLPPPTVATPRSNVAPSAHGTGHTRAFIKVQEGCNDVCAFCIVPRTRGRERSVPTESVVAAVRQAQADGAHEVVLTGTQLGVYGRDLDAADYGPAALIEAALVETDVARIRFSSLQPQDITPRLLGLWDDPRLCRHFHLALQSGSDSVLRRMRRRYTIAEYARALDTIRATVPGVGITTDVIVGFPGESEAEHGESIAFCRDAGFAQTHVFPYSGRSGTSANLLADQIPTPLVRRRASEMTAVSQESAATFRRRLIGQTVAVLFEGDGDGSDARAEAWRGLTDSYVRVTVRSRGPLRNRLLAVRLVAEGEDTLHGVLAGGSDQR